MKILVTGGAGYAGTSLIPKLLERGHAVLVFDSLRRDVQPLIPFFRNPRFDLLPGDVRDAAALGRVVRDCDAVVHLAAVSGYPACNHDPDTARAVNVDGTRNVAQAAGERMVVFASSGSCYGKLEGRCTEESPLNPVSLYGETKAMGERIMLEQCRPVIYRFATAFGLSANMRYDLLLNHLCLHAVRSGSLHLYEPQARRTFIHVDDMAASIVFALDNYASMAGKIYNVGDETGNMTKMQAVRLIREVLPQVTVEVDPQGKDADMRDYAVDYARIRKTGFRVQADVASGIGEMIRAFRFTLST